MPGDDGQAVGVGVGGAHAADGVEGREGHAGARVSYFPGESIFIFFRFPIESGKLLGSPDGDQNIIF